MNNATITSDLNVSGLATFNNIRFNSSTIVSSMNISGFATFNNATIISSLNVSGITTLSNNTTITGTLNISGNSNFSSSIYVKCNDNKVFSFDSGGYGRLGFIKQFGDQPKICAAAGSSITFSHLSSGSLLQKFQIQV